MSRVRTCTMVGSMASECTASEGSAQGATALHTYRRALDDAIAAFPSDVELLLERGVAASTDVRDRGQGSVPGSIAFYDRVLAIDRDNFAAHHYLTHAYENAGRIEEALAHGAVYARSAPDVPHALDRKSVV